MTTTIIYNQIFSFLNRVNTNFNLDTDFLTEASALCEKLNIANCSIINNFSSDITIDTTVEDRVTIYDNFSSYDLNQHFTYTYTNASIGEVFIEISPIDVNTMNSDYHSAYQAFSDLLYLYFSRMHLCDYINLMTHYDIQTKLPNLKSLEEYYSKLQATGYSNAYAVLFLNLQNFKYINQVGGSQIGDLAIIKYSQKLTSLIKKDEFLARLGGDNFLVLLKKQHLDEFLDYIDDIILTDFPGYPDRLFHVSAWCGICPDDLDEASLDMRIDRALNALQFAKTKLYQKNVYYSDKLYDYFSWTKKVIGSFRKCLDAEEFIPFYQPKVHIPTGEIIGLEALVRWIHNDEIIFPDRFIPIIEANAMIPQLDLFILKKTCSDIRSWLDQGLNPPIVSVNMSRKDLYVPSIEETVYNIIQDAGISTSYIEIEITENINEEEYGRLVEFLHKLKGYGIKISIDDFGNGYSSLSLLKNIEPDILKIDKSFVHDCMIDKRSVVLIQKIIELAHCLDINVIAEGVEAVGQALFLLDVGCQNAQGYLYDKPLCYTDISLQLQSGNYQALKDIPTK